MASLLKLLLFGCLMLASIVTSSAEEGKSKLQGKQIKIDIAAIADYALYRRFLMMAKGYPRGNLTQVAEAELALYMASNIRAASNLFSTVDLGIDVSIELRVHSTKIIRSTAEATRLLVVGRSNGTADAKDMLTAASYIMDTEAIPSDVLLIFTGLDLFHDGNLAVRGIAQKSSVCLKHAVAIVEFDTFHSQFHIAHELAHTLGASHYGTDCPDGAMMSFSTGEAKNPSDYLLSTCAQDDILKHLEFTYKTESDCLLNSLPPVPDTPSLSEFPGSEFNVDRQCQLINGPLAYFCRGRISGEEMCSENLMPCSSMTSSLCVNLRLFPLPGTPCGVGKWCHQGKCVADPRAPKKECPYGDQTVRVDYSNVMETCDSVVARNPGFCYFYESICCEACSKIKIAGDHECRYGDLMPNCQKNRCGTQFYTVSYDSQCCRTCK